MKRARLDRGLTLIELVVAMAVFALVAVMGLQSLSGSLRQRDRLVEISAETAALSRGAALLRNDLASILPMLFFPPEEGSAPQSALRADRDGQGFSHSLGGQPALDRPLEGRDAAAMQRAEWRLDASAGTLRRRTWPTLFPADAAQAAPEAVVLEGVLGIGLRSFWTGDGWVAGLRPQTPQPVRQTGVAADGDTTGAAPEIYSDQLPRAVEITLETRDHGRLVLVEFLQ